MQFKELSKLKTTFTYARHTAHRAEAAVLFLQKRGIQRENQTHNNDVTEDAERILLFY